MRRLIDQSLDRWAASERRKPLIVRGARQIGKTWSIKDLGKRRFDTTVVVDLEKKREWHRVFEGNLDVHRIISELEVLTHSRIKPGGTLLFFDEIQACPKAIGALRYFYEEIPDLHVIAAGSLLEFAIGDYPVPVGRVQYLEMYPMTFLETLWAAGNEPAADVIAAIPAEVPEATHEFLMSEVRRYCFVGGMPEAVAAYLKSEKLADAFEVHTEICQSLRQDFGKYSPRVDPDVINQVLTSVANGVGGQIKYTKLALDCSGPTAKAALELLIKARIIRKVPSADPSGVPLAAGARATKFKAVLVDTGLWQNIAGITASIEYMRNDLLAVHRGAMAEQFVGQEMTVSQNGALYYWARDERGSSAEVDYLAVHDAKISAVEVKSGTAGSLRSLHMILKTYGNLAGGLVFQSGRFSVLPEQRLTFLPLYMAFAATGGKVN